MTGKTILASLVVEEATKLLGATVLYFYFRHGDPQRSSFTAIAKSLIAQTLIKDDLLYSYLFGAATDSKKPMLDTRKLAGELLDVCLKAVGKTYIVLDGLDECEEIEEKAIVDWFRKYVEQSATSNPQEPVRCVFFSQADSCTTSLLSKLPTLQITRSDNYADISYYSTQRARDIQAKFQCSDDEKLMISRSVTERAEGEQSRLLEPCKR